MKKLFYFTFFLSGIFVASCASDKKDEENSPAPSTDIRDKFVAYWNVSENSAVIGGTTTHSVNIQKSTTSNSDIIISNFSGLSVSAHASVSSNVLTIPYQAIGSPTVIGFAAGSGTLTSGTTISMTYTTNIGGSRDSCTSVYTKQ